MSFRPIRIFRAAGLVYLMVVAPATASAQAAIAGSVKNLHGDPMAGVTVDASSPSLIERKRTTVTDLTGRYRIEDLRPGLYAVRFTLTGWTPVERTGIELSGTLTATVDAELAVGSITDTVTVTAELPVVDVHSAKQEVTLSGDVVRSIPTVRTYNALVPLIPGVLTNVNDTITGPSATSTSFPIHGGRTNEGRLSLDGLHDRQPAERQLRDQLRRRRRQRAGSDVHDGGRARRVGDGGPGDEHRVEERRQHDARLALRERHGRDVPVGQSDA